MFGQSPGAGRVPGRSARLRGSGCRCREPALAGPGEAAPALSRQSCVHTVNRLPHQMLQQYFIYAVEDVMHWEGLFLIAKSYFCLLSHNFRLVIPLQFQLKESARVLLEFCIVVLRMSPLIHYPVQHFMLSPLRSTA